MPTPEETARQLIDAKLAASGWIVQTYTHMDLGAGSGLAVTEFPGANGPADYLLYIDGKAIGVVEAKPVGHTLKGVEGQSASYADGLAAKLPAWQRPLPFQYESTGEVTQFTNWTEPHARSRDIFSFHCPQTLREMAQEDKPLRARLREMPELPMHGLWPKQHTAIANLEQKSLRLAKPRALIQMATGSGKTFTAANIAYRLIRYGHARRVCFLVDRTNLGIQTLKEFQQFHPPGERHAFDRLYNIAFPQRNHFDPVNRVIITTIQRLYSVLTGQPDLAAEDEERSTYENPGAFRKPPVPITYNPIIPPEFFDAIIIDECHRSIYSVWGDVLRYFDAFLIGLTATPSKQTIGFFDQNLVMEYTHEQAVADRVNVPYDVYEIKTKITVGGSKVDAGFFVGKRSRKTRRERQEELDEDLAYSPADLDRAVVSEPQIRTVIQTFRDKLFTEIFPGRTEVPKTIIFAKDDSHADDIVRIVREEFGRGNDFCQKITYRTGTMRVTDRVKDADGTEREVVRYEKIKGKTGEDVLAAFRNSFNPRIAVTVDMIATGTDVKPVEVVFFMRSIKSSNYFEQMKGRGVRIMPADALKGVTPDAMSKTRFVIVDAVGVCEQTKSDRGPIDRQPKKSLKQVLDYIKAGGTDPDAVSALAGKLMRLSADMSEKQQEEVRKHTGGASADDLVRGLVAAIDDANVEAKARELNPGVLEPTPPQLEAAEQVLIKQAIKPFYDPHVRDVLLQIKQENEQIIDRVSRDEVLSAGYSQAALGKARAKIEDFKRFIEEHKDELTALQVFYGQATPDRLRFSDLKELAEQIKRPPLSATTEELWRCYEALESAKTNGKGGQIITDLVSLIRHTLRPGEPLTPFAPVVRERYAAWRKQQAEAGVNFTDEQSKWLDKIAEHIATSLAIEMDDFADGWFAQRGNLGKAHELFGDRLANIVAEMNRVLTA